MRLSNFIVAAGLFACQPRAQAAPPLAIEGGVSASPFDISRIQLLNGRFADNENRTLNYTRTVDVNRLLYVFRNNHKLSTQGAQSNGGWDSPSLPPRPHFQGHILSAWAQCYATLKDSTCRSQALAMTAAMINCQANNKAAGFNTGYLSGFPESAFDALEKGQGTGGNVPWYVIHKNFAGLLDVWRDIGDDNAKNAVMALAGWVDWRTSRLSYANMQNVLQTEHGGMSAVLTDLYYQTGDKKWLTTAARFDHTAIMDALAANRDQLNGLHANTNIPKWIGAAREYKATGNQTYLSVARNAWNIALGAHTYAPGGNSEAEHFHEPNGIASQLKSDTMEHCNSYNMLKLTRELWAVDPSNAAYFENYERTLFNHILAAQDTNSNHGSTTYFTGLNPGGQRGQGPAWEGDGPWSSDYNSFWCCQGSSVEVNTKHMDSVYGQDSSSLFVNLFIPSVLNWSEKSVKVTQTTIYPVGDTTTLQVSGSGTWAMKNRVPSWAKAAVIKVNGQAITTPSAGSYAVINRSWANGDTVTAQFPMNLRTVVANDNNNLAVVAYGPVMLTGLSSATSPPTLQLSSLKRASSSALNFTASVGGQTINLQPFYDTQHTNIVTYFRTTGSVPN